MAPGWFSWVVQGILMLRGRMAGVCVEGGGLSPGEPPFLYLFKSLRDLTLASGLRIRDIPVCSKVCLRPSLVGFLLTPVLCIFLKKLFGRFQVFSGTLWSS